MIRTCIRNVGLIRNSFTGAAIRLNSTEPNRTRAKGKLRLNPSYETKDFEKILPQKSEMLNSLGQFTKIHWL